MSLRTPIEWTDASWNPVRGCSKISAGCKHCYAEQLLERFRGVLGHAFELGFEPRLVPEKLCEPLKWAKPRRIFVCSVSDLFQDAVPEHYVRMVFEVMAAANWHTYQVLTKRAARMSAVVARLPEHLRNLPHVWLGVSVEDQQRADERIPLLADTPAALRFLSCEPLLEPVDLRFGDRAVPMHLAIRERIHWVIVGGESGRGARPMEADWARSIRDQCEDAQVAFFFKQWGGVRKKLAGRELDDRTHDAMPDGGIGTPLTPTPGARRERLDAITNTLAALTEGAN